MGIVMVDPNLKNITEDAIHSNKMVPMEKELTCHKNTAAS